MEVSADRRWSIVEILFEKKSRKRQPGRRHTGIERGSLGHRNVGHRSGPTDSIAIHMLPHSLRRAGLDRTVVEREVVPPKVRVASATTSENMTTPTSAQRHHGTGQSETSLVSAFPTTPSRLIIHAARQKQGYCHQSNGCVSLIGTEAIPAVPHYRCARKYEGCFISYSQGFAET